MGGGALNIEIHVLLSPITPSLAPSSSSSGVNFPISVNNSPPLQQSYTSTQRGEIDNNSMFRLPPSRIEVETAISALQNYLRKLWSSESEFQTRGGHGNGRVEEAFRMLLTDPITQRVVFSLSSDRAVWDAVMNNEMVQQLQQSNVLQAQNHRIQGFNGESDLITWIMNWIMRMIKAKVAQLTQKFELLMNQIFLQIKAETPNRESKDEIDDRIISSFILSLVIILIVVVARFHRD